MRQLLLAAVLATAAFAVAAESTVRVDKAWARATALGAPNGGVFMKIDNSGSNDDRLLRAGSGLARAVELHTHKMEGSVARMIEVANIALPAGKSVELKPGGLHVMLIGLARPLKEGEKFPLKLEFEKGGTQTVEVIVRGIGASFEHPPGHQH